MVSWVTTPWRALSALPRRLLAGGAGAELAPERCRVWWLSCPGRAACAALAAPASRVLTPLGPGGHRSLPQPCCAGLLRRPAPPGKHLGPPRRARRCVPGGGTAPTPARRTGATRPQAATRRPAPPAHTLEEPREQQDRRQPHRPPQGSPPIFGLRNGVGCELRVTIAAPFQSLDRGSVPVPPFSSKEPSAMNASHPARITLSTPHEVIAAVPHLLGFQPAPSLRSARRCRCSEQFEQRAYKRIAPRQHQCRRISTVSLDHPLPGVLISCRSASQRTSIRSVCPG